MKIHIVMMIGIFGLIAHNQSHATPTINWQSNECHKAVPTTKDGAWTWLCEQKGVLTLDNHSSSLHIKIDNNYPNTYAQHGETIFYQHDKPIGFSLQVANHHINNAHDWQELAISTQKTLPIHIRFFSNNVQSGQAYHFTGGLLASLKTKNTNQQKDIINVNLPAFTSYPTVSTCKLTMGQHLSLPLKSISINELTNTQEPLRQSFPFNLLYDCPENQQVHISFTDANDWSNTTTTLKNTGTAKGVGLRLYHNNQPIKLDRPPMPQSFRGQPNVIRLEHSGRQAGLNNFEVGYVKTDSEISAGSISSTTLISFYYE